MNNLEAIEQLEDLKRCFEQFTHVETKEEDIEAFNIAIESLKREIAPVKNS